jgi:outer membrane receptor protein involved in Fe transport
MLPFAPKLTSALTVNYVFPSPNLDGQVSIDGVYSYSSKSFSDPLNDPATQRISSHDLVNVRLSYLPNNSRWNFSLWVRNLFDKDTVVLRSRDFLGNLYDRRMDPRIVGIEARFDY